MKLNANLAKATAVGALGGLLFGFDTAVISGTTHSLTAAYALTPWTLGITVFMALGGAADCPLPWRLGNWRLVGAGTDIHRGTGSREDARAAGRIVPDQHRHRHLAGVSLELRDCATGIGRGGMALAIRGGGVSGGAVSGDAVCDSAQPALAGHEEAGGRSARRFADDGVGRSRGRAARNRAVGAPRALGGIGATVHVEIPAADFSGH